MPGKKQDLRRIQHPLIGLEEAVQGFISRGEARNLSQSTLRFYRTRLRRFVQHLADQGHQVEPDGVTADMLRGFIAAEKERVSVATADHTYRALRAFFRFLAKEEAIPRDPMDRVEKVRVPRRVIETFSPEQIKLVLSACGSGFTGRRLQAMLLLLLDCGLRVSELCRLQLDDICWENRTLRIMGKGSKERRVPFGETCRQVLRSYLARRGDLPDQNAVFVTCYGDTLNRVEAHRLVSEHGKRSGITGLRCSPHTFRHTCAVMYLRNGGDVFSLQRLLGHSSLEMTRRYAELAEIDVIARHRVCSPGDRFQASVGTVRGRRRMQ